MHILSLTYWLHVSGIHRLYQCTVRAAAAASSLPDCQTRRDGSKNGKSTPFHILFIHLSSHFIFQFLHVVLIEYACLLACMSGDTDAIRPIEVTASNGTRMDMTH